MQSVALKEELRLNTVGFNIAETRQFEQDAYARRLVQENDNLSRRLISVTEVTQQGSSLRDDHDARLRRAVAEAIHREAVLNHELQALIHD